MIDMAVTPLSRDSDTLNYLLLRSTFKKNSRESVSKSQHASSAPSSKNFVLPSVVIDMAAIVHAAAARNSSMVEVVTILTSRVPSVACLLA